MVDSAGHPLYRVFEPSQTLSGEIFVEELSGSSKHELKVSSFGVQSNKTIDYQPPSAPPLDSSFQAIGTYKGGYIEEVFRSPSDDGTVFVGYKVGKYAVFSFHKST